MYEDNIVVLNSQINVEGMSSAFHASLPSDFKYDGEEHNGWEFVYVESGSIKVGSDDKTYILRKGELICHKPHEFHTIRSYRGESDVIIFCFHCNAKEMQFFNNKIFFVNHRQKMYLNDIVAASTHLFLPKDPIAISDDEGMDKNPEANYVSEQFLKNSLELLILSLLSAESTERKERMKSYSLYLQRKTLTSDIKKYIELHLAEKISLSEISRHFSYSPSSIKRIFRDEEGCSIIQYITDYRVDNAKVLLEKGFPVTYVAQEVGFDTINYFSTVFKERTGLTPSEYKKSLK